MRASVAFVAALVALSATAMLLAPPGGAATGSTTHVERAHTTKKTASRRAKKRARCVQAKSRGKATKHASRHSTYRKTRKCPSRHLPLKVLKSLAQSGTAGGTHAQPAVPVASFSYSPAAPTVNHAITFDGSVSACPAGPCTYEWGVDAAPNQPLPQTLLGDGQHLSVTFPKTGVTYVRLLVTNVLGQSATSEQNVPVASEPPAQPSPAPPSSPPPVAKEASGSQQTNCIAVPSICGYPDATNTGVPAGTALTSQSQNISVNKAGSTIKNIALTAEVIVEADNTTIEDSEITVNGTQKCSESCGGRGIWIKPGVTGTLIKNVSCHGGAPTGEDVTQYCIMSNDSATTIEALHAYNCTECLAGAMNVSNSFIDETGVSIPGEHYEDIYYGGGAGPLIVNHNTMLNPEGQTAVVFASVDFGDQTTLTITNNLMAGGGYMLYGGGSGSGGKVVGPVTVTGNHFSRKYYPQGGYYGVASYFESSVTAWSGNVWDESLKSVAPP